MFLNRKTIDRIYKEFYSEIVWVVNLDFYYLPPIARSKTIRQVMKVKLSYKAVEATNKKNDLTHVATRLYVGITTAHKTTLLHIPKRVLKV